MARKVLQFPCHVNNPVNNFLKISLDFWVLMGYIITMKENMKNNKTAQTDFIVTTTNGTRWAETGASFGEVRRKFFGKRIGMKIASVERGRLFTHEEERELREDKIKESCR